MKNSSQTQHHRSETKRKEEKKIEKNSKLEDAGCKLEAGSRTVAARRRNQWNSDELEAKIRYAGIFSIIEKITVHSKNFNFRYAQCFSL